MRGKVTLCAAALVAVMLIAPASALEYTIGGPAVGDFGTPTSDNTIYVTDQNNNVDRSKNAALLPPVIAAPNVGYPAAVTDATVTSDLLYVDGHIATLHIPALGVSVKVYEGTDSTQLAKGASHFPDSSMWDGNVCVAGHNRGTNCYFGQIHTLPIGETIILTTKLGTRTYAVTNVTKVSETDHSMLAATTENCITLFTCVRNQPQYRWCVRAVEMRHKN